MAEKKSSFNSGSQDPYSILGVEPGESFENIKKARDQKLLEIGDELIARARVEAAYDSLLMSSLKERQLGNVSNDAKSASKKEELQGKEVSGLGINLLTRLNKTKSSIIEGPNNNFWPKLKLPFGDGLIIRISIGLLFLVLILVSPDESVDIILALSAIGSFISQIKKGRKPLSSLLWSFSLLCLGLIIGEIFVNGTNVVSEITSYSLTTDKLEALPAIILLWFGSLFFE